MARGWSGASVRPDGSILVGPVTIPDRRVEVTCELLLDLSSPGVCLAQVDHEKVILADLWDFF